MGIAASMEGSHQSCHSLQPPASPTSLQKQLNNLFMKLIGSALSDDPHKDAFQIVETAIKELLDADRASLFLLDKQTQELHACIFSVTNEESADVNTVHLDQDPTTPSHIEDHISNLGKKPLDIVSYRGKRVSLPMSKGVIGFVARTGNFLNVKNTKKNEYFCSEIDKFTGYKTETLLCVPLIVDGRVMGVLEALNKKRGHFSKIDEQIIQSVALACGLYLSHSHLKRECKRLETKCKVANELLQYHRVCSVQHLKEVEEIPRALIQQHNIDSFFCDTDLIPGDIKAHLLVKMVSNLVDSSLFNSQQLLKFALTVSKNYRSNPYHNWDHAFHVAHCMYCILKGAPGYFNSVEKLSLVLACLCHDLDHRALNNCYMASTNHPLSQLYSTSTLENHHFSQTIELLQLDGLNVFTLLAESQYKEAFEITQKAILATDLVNFFKNRSALANVLDSKSFSWEIPRHKDLVRCLMMTVSDVCSSCKPWDIHVKNVTSLFQEFHVQGDMEKAQGLSPIEMVDRNFKYKLPSIQVGFIKGITEPCCQLLSTVMPHVDFLLQTAKSNKEMWQDIADKKTELPTSLKD